MLALISASLIVSCKNNSEPKAAEATAPTTEAAAGGSMCFLLVENKVDSTKISLKVSGDDVTGEMAWQPHEKDGAIGKLSGKRVGDTLKLIYDYTIEGSAQQEEKWFLLQGEKLSEGNGELTEKKAVLVYKDTKKIKFDKSFTKVACK